MIRKAFKYRIYPDSEQQAKLAIQFGCARFVYNHYRAVREGYYHDTGTGLNYNDCAIDLSDILKVDYPWLKEADSQALQQALKDLDRAYANFFDGRADYPTCKRKFDKQSIRYPQRFKLEGGNIYLPKVGWVKVICHRRIEGTMKNCTVSRTKSGKYFVAIQCEIEYTVPEQRQGSIGIDLGLSVSDAGWSQFVAFIEYKAAWAGREVAKHDRWFASSKTCNDCGAVNKDLKLSDRTWVCQSCGVIHDRDENAAMNLRPSTVGTTGINADGDMSSVVMRSASEKFKISLEAQRL